MTTPTPDALAASCRAFALQCKPFGVSGVLNEAADLIQQQRAEIEMLSAALEFYANRRSYGTRKVHRGIRYSDVDLDGGERARNALGEE